MISRILGIIVCLSLMAWGVVSINNGIRSDHFGPILGGVLFLAFPAVVMFIIIYDTALHLVGIVTHQHEGAAHDLEPFQDDFTFHRELNTPDPHLIHPDDAKREARARLNIKV
jgi:hypothetical protein